MLQSKFKVVSLTKETGTLPAISMQSAMELLQVAVPGLDEGILSDASTNPIDGTHLFGTFRSIDAIMMCVNPRIAALVLGGIFRAAAETGSAFQVELAHSESTGMRTGYAGITPAELAVLARHFAKMHGVKAWGLHADHLPHKLSKQIVEYGDDAEALEADYQAMIARMRKDALDHWIAAGATSFAPDTSYLFDMDPELKVIGETGDVNVDFDPEFTEENIAKTRKQLALVVRAFVDQTIYIREQLGHNRFSSEGEVGEIGWKVAGQQVLTTPLEAAVWNLMVREQLEAKGYHIRREGETDETDPDMKGIDIGGLATSNGSQHGDAVHPVTGQVVDTKINLVQTAKVVAAIRKYAPEWGFTPISIVQHGFSGTPLSVVENDFNRGDFTKTNVGTHWQNKVVWAVLAEFPAGSPERALYDEAMDFAVQIWGDDFPGKPAETVWAKMGKQVTGLRWKDGKWDKSGLDAYWRFLHKLMSLSDEAKAAIEEKAYQDALAHFAAFNAQGTAVEVLRRSEAIEGVVEEAAAADADKDSSGQGQKGTRSYEEVAEGDPEMARNK